MRIFSEQLAKSREDLIMTLTEQQNSVRISLSLCLCAHNCTVIFFL